jgi:site-specific recombinase XerD
MSQAEMYRMIGHRAVDAGIQTKDQLPHLLRHRHQEHLRNGGKLEVAQQMANHQSARTTSVEDRRNDPGLA